MRDHHAPRGTGLRPGLLPLLAATCGIAVANIYFPQAISPLAADGLGVSPGAAAAAVIATQFGYALGLFLLVPLGDRVPHRRLIPLLLAVTGIGLLAAGSAPGLPALVAAGALTGAATVVPQIVIPMAAGLVPDDRRGAVTGTLLSGLVAGILLARTFGGSLGQWLGWRAPYYAAALLAALLAAVLRRALPDTAPASRERYASLVAAAPRLLREEPELRRSCWYQAAVFGGFSAAWTSIALYLTGPAYGLGSQAVGLVALAGAGSVLCTPLAGRRVDRHGPDPVSAVCLLGTLAATGVLSLGALRGAPGLVALTLGALLLDAAMQSGQVAHQARVFSLRPEARGRLNTAYMTCAFLGGGLGSWLGVRAFALLGWPGVTGLAALLAALPLAHLAHLARRARRARRASPGHRAARAPERAGAREG
ncbi:MFS transporter [Streptomyces hoynatensis]|uniref:MFS transporter n=1 Tax=Streptomyces hoynatensis TaxID=1141874 RepID=UPI001F4D80DC|nr:MFS transporter [Streptomyces hoynatensis]